VLWLGDDPGFDIVVAGLPLAARLGCALARAVPAREVWVVTAPGNSAAMARLEAAVAAHPEPPTLHHVDGPIALAAALHRPGEILLAARPGVLDPRAAIALLEPDCPPASILASAASADVAPLLYRLGSDSAAAFLTQCERDADGAGTAVATIEPRETRASAPQSRLLCEVVRTADQRRHAEQRVLASGHKSADTWVARHVDRRLSLFLSRRLVSTAIRPNQITIVSTGIGLAGAAFIAAGGWANAIVGALLLVASIITDGCDGEIARIKFMESETGRKLDFFLDNLVNVSAIAAVGIGHVADGGAPLFLWLSLLSAGGALASVGPVYFLFFRQAKAAGPAPAERSLAESVAGRDFVYVILALALFDRAHWFAVASAPGVLFFLVVVMRRLQHQLRDQN
jgi:phosphatidylglycerophosphate synthase